MEFIDTLALDRGIAGAARAARSFARALRADPLVAATDRWFASDRQATTRTTFVAVSEAALPDTLREGLRRWVYALALARISMPVTVPAAAERVVRSIRIERPEVGVFSVRELVQRAIAEPVVERRELWLDVLLEAGERVRAAEHRRAEATREISARLGVEDDASLRMPYARTAVQTAARGLLDATRDLAREAFEPCRGLGGLVAMLLARDVPGAWPARPGARWLEETFGGTILLEGLELDLGPTPAPLGASSVARVLARFGAAYARAAADRSGSPFAVGHDATDAHPLRRGALFGGLIAVPAFLRWRFGFSRDTSRDVARATTRTLLGAARIEAVRSLVDMTVAPPAEVQEAFDEALCIPYPRQLCCVLPRPCLAAPNRLAGMLLANSDRDRLVERYDEDWFRNPRALAHLRELDCRPAPLVIPDEQLVASPKPWAQALEQRLA